MAIWRRGLVWRPLVPRSGQHVRSLPVEAYSSVALAVGFLCQTLNAGRGGWPAEMIQQAREAAGCGVDVRPRGMTSSSDAWVWAWHCGGSANSVTSEEGASARYRRRKLHRCWLVPSVLSIE